MGAGTNTKGYGGLLFFNSLIEKADVSVYLSHIWMSDARRERENGSLTVSYAVCAMLTFSSAVRIASSEVWAMCWRSVRTVSPGFGLSVAGGLAFVFAARLSLALCEESREPACVAGRDVSPP